MNSGRIICLIFTLLVPSYALSWNPETDCPKRPDDSTKAQIVAGELFGDAEVDYQESRPLLALKGFLCSHRILQHENTLFNIAQIAKLVEHQESSLDILKEFTANVQGNHIAQPIKEIIADMENNKLRSDSPAGTDETDVNEETKTDDIKSTSVEESNPSPVVPPSPKRRLKITGIALLAVGGAGLIAGGFFQGLSMRAKDSAQDSDDLTIFENEHDKMKRFQTGALVSFIASGALAGAGLVLYLLSRNNESQQTNAISVVPGYQGLVLMGRF